MPPKKKTTKITLQDKLPQKKWVKRANMWAVTQVKDGKQIIEWFIEEPKL